MNKTSQPEPKISITQAKDALLRSGYLLEVRLQSVLEDHGYYADANAVYLDPITGKSREFDIYALIAYQISRDMDFLFQTFIIECVNNPQPLVLLTKEPQIGFMFHEDIKLSGLPVKVLVDKSQDSWELIPEFLKMNKYLHFCTGRVATQFCSFSYAKSKKKWIAEHEGSHFESLQKVCDAINYSVDSHFKGWEFGEEESMDIQFYYPLIVVQGELIDARPSKKSVKLKKVDHLVFRRTIIQGTKETNYNIDIVTERFFSEYLSLVESEMLKTVSRIKRRKKDLRRSMESIIQKAKRLRSPDKIRKAMDM
jgi:hypothetical protein